MKINKETEWVAPNVLIEIDRDYLEEAMAANINLLDADGKLNDIDYTQIYYEVNENIWEFLMESCSLVEERKRINKSNDNKIN